MIPLFGPLLFCAAAGMVCFERRLGSLDENEDWAGRMVDANKTIFVLAGILKHSLPLFKFITTPKWKRFLDAEDFFYAYECSLLNKLIEEIFMKIDI